MDGGTNRTQRSCVYDTTTMEAAAIPEGAVTQTTKVSSHNCLYAFVHSEVTGNAKKASETRRIESSKAMTLKHP